MKLYHYDHCPYCVRARMALGYAQLPFTLHTLLSDDEATPIRMIGKKMLPILDISSKEYLAESLDIVDHVISLTANNQEINSPPSDMILEWTEGRIKELTRFLCWPRWMRITLEEFKTSTAKEYFRNKKEAQIGCFSDHLLKSPEYIEETTQELERLEHFIAKHDFTYMDNIHLFPILRCLSVVKDIQFPQRVLNYMQDTSTSCRVPLFTHVAI